MINIGIVGFGNLGRGVLEQIKNFCDLKLVCVFTRRDLKQFSFYEEQFDNLKNIENYVGKIDVMIMCGGSAKDLGWQSKEVLKNFCIVDSFDTHARIFEHYQQLEKVGEENGHLALLSAGWDPGIFSMMRLLFLAISQKDACTFWGKGISQGHSDAVRKIDGVLDARQYTIPIKAILKKTRCGKVGKIVPTKSHIRRCFVVLKKGANKKQVEKEIKTMPHYFSGYKTKVNFVSLRQIIKKHNKLCHGGNVVGFFETKNKNKNLMEFSLKLDSNPEFTASVLLCYARAVYKLFKEKKVGAITVFDIPLSCLTNFSNKYLLTNIM